LSHTDAIASAKAGTSYQRVNSGPMAGACAARRDRGRSSPRVMPILLLVRQKPSVRAAMQRRACHR
jgi:hypothetical protein